MFNEDNTVEQMLIEAATQSGWQYVKSQDIPRSSDSVLVESWLLEAIYGTVERLEQKVDELSVSPKNTEAESTPVSVSVNASSR